MAPKTSILKTSTPPWHLVKIWGHLDPRCALKFILYLWGVKQSFIGNWIEVVIFAVMDQYTFLILLFWALFLFALFFFFLEKHFSLYLFLFIFLIGSDDMIDIVLLWNVFSLCLYLSLGLFISYLYDRFFIGFSLNVII